MITHVDKLWVRIPVLDGHWFVVKLYYLFGKTENKRKRGRGRPLFKAFYLSISILPHLQQPFTWQTGTLFLPLEQTTTQVWPGNDSEQYPGNPGHVMAETSRPEIANTKGESPGLVVMWGDSCSKGRGFESRHHILDGHFSHIFVVKIVMMFVWKDRK